MSEGLAERDRVRDLLGKVVSPEVASELLRKDVTSWWGRARSHCSFLRPAQLHRHIRKPFAAGDAGDFESLLHPHELNRGKHGGVVENTWATL